MSGGSFAVVAVGDEGHGHDPRGQALAAHFEFERGPLGGMGRIDIGHRDRVTERGGKAAAGDGADLRRPGVYFGAFARGGAAFERQADAFYTSGLLLDDGLIDPRDTRRVVAVALAICDEAARRTLSPMQFGVARP